MKNWLPVWLLVFALAAGAALWHAGDAYVAAHSAAENGPALVGGPFTLIDQNGKAVSDADFRGRFMLVFFGYTQCPDVCPTTLAEVQAALTQMGPQAARVVPIFISVDPERDTPAVLKAYLASFGPRFVGLTGTPEAIAAIAKEYKVYYRKHPAQGGSYAVDHSSILYLMDKGGHYLGNYAIETGPDAMAKDLEQKTG